MKMNRLIKFTQTFAFLIFIAGSSFINKVNAQPMGDISMQTFYDDLEPYGQWVDDPDYGYVWVPEVDDPDFRPYYTRGHWVMSEYGNMWVSDYDWGWAPFHYGRWAFTDYYGWVWIPDVEWGPAWVSWRTGGDYYGWAPMGPGISIDIAIGGYSCPDFWWTFVPRRHFFSIGFSRYFWPYSRNYSIIHSTTIINNVYYRNNYRCVAGPWARDIGRYYGGRIQVYNIHHAGRAGRTVIRNNNINIYRPSVNRRGDNRPGRYVNRDTYRNNRQGQGYNNRNGRSGNNYGNNRGYNNRNNNTDRRRDNASVGSQDRRRQFESNRRVERQNNNGRNGNSQSDRRNDARNRNEGIYRRESADMRNNSGNRQRDFNIRNNNPRPNDRPNADRSRNDRPNANRPGNNRPSGNGSNGREFNQRSRTPERQYGNSGQQRNSNRREYTPPSNNRSRNEGRSNGGNMRPSRESQSQGSGNRASQGRSNNGNSGGGQEQRRSRGHGG